jgi:alkylation response protein AidB-like acyl-CoA dehydrogenase
VTILQALGRGDPSVALIAAMTLFQHAAQARQPTWPAALYTEVMAESASRPVLINARRVEPELGTPARGGLPATTARREPGGWSLSGRKIFSTGAVGLRWMAVWTRTDEPVPRVGSFLVRSDAPGITIEPTWDHLGLRASRSDDVIFADTPVPADAVAGLADPDAAPVRDTMLMAWNGLGLTALYLGVAAAARDWLIGFLTERTPAALGRPLATLPRFQSAVGEIETRGDGQAHRHQGRDRGGGAGGRTGRQQRLDQEIPVGTALPRRIVRSRAHASGRLGGSHGRAGGLHRGRTSRPNVYLTNRFYLN